VVNNAGVVSGKSFLELEEADVRRTFDVNALAHFWLNKIFLKDVIERRKGNSASQDPVAIVNVSSLMGYMAGKRLTDYGASKWAANGLHESLRLEIRAMNIHRDVHTMLVCPYVVDTGMFDGAFDVGKTSKAPWYVRAVWRMFPKLETNAVARAIVQGLCSRRNVLILPWYFHLVPGVLQLLPPMLRDPIEEFAGARHGMDSFRGRVSGIRTKGQ